MMAAVFIPKGSLYMDEHNHNHMLRLIAGAIFIAFISAVGVYIYFDDRDRGQRQQIEEQKQKEIESAQEIERLKTEKDAIEKQRQEEEEKREAERAAEEERRIREKYTHYHNDTFGFSIDVPKNFTILKNTANATYLRSLDTKGMISVLGVYNVNNMTTKQVYEAWVAGIQRDGMEITYQVCGDDWFVVSGHGGGLGDYHKYFVNRDQVLSLGVLFPMSQKDEYAPMIEHMEDTFRRDRP
jgi:hypothetical protein